MSGNPTGFPRSQAPPGNALLLRLRLNVLTPLSSQRLPSIAAESGACGGRFCAGSIGSVSGISSIGASGFVSGCENSRRRESLVLVPLSLAEYLTLVRWTGRQLREGNRGVIPADPPPILQRLGLAADGWLCGIESFGRLFRAAIGRASALADFAASRGRRWLHGISAARPSAESASCDACRHRQQTESAARDSAWRLSRPTGRTKPGATSPKAPRSSHRTAGLRRTPQPTCNSGPGPVQ